MTTGVGKPVVAIFMTMVLILVAHNIVFSHYFTKTETYGPFVELAGRQRFLAQRLGFLIERGRSGGKGYAVPAIEATMESFNDALTVFELGGDYLGRSYPPAPADLTHAVEAQRNVWTQLDAHLDDLIEGDDAPWPDRDVHEAESIIGKLTASSFGLVEEFERWRQKLLSQLLYSVVGTSLLAMLTLVAAWRIAWAKLVTPVRKLRDEALRVSEKGPHHNPGDELGVVSTVVNEMSQSVGRLRDEREQVTRQLRRVEADYQSVFDNAVAGIFQFDAAGELLLANPAVARILGYADPTELEESIRNVHRDMFADPEHASLVHGLGDGKGTIESQAQMLRKDGTVLWVLESSAIVRRHGHDYCCESVVVDVTEMKTAQDGLREISGLLLSSQEQERRRIARELHDSTGQLLAALEMNLGRLKDFVGDAVDTIETTSELANQCSREIRSVSYLLHPPLLEELGLVYAVRDYAAGFGKRAAIEVELDLPTDLERLHDDTEIALFRVIQEALTNIHRHADSAVARIRLSVTADTVVVEIEDQGRGLPAEMLGDGSRSLAHMGVGMRGMEERLRQLGGRLTLTSSPRGTLVRGEVPRRVGTSDAAVSAPMFGEACMSREF